LTHASQPAADRKRTPPTLFTATDRPIIRVRAGPLKKSAIKVVDNGMMRPMPTPSRARVASRPAMLCAAAPPTPQTA